MSYEKSNYHIQTTAIHGGNHQKTKGGDPLISPEIRSTVFRHKPDMSEASFQYTRSANPNRTELENKLTLLELGADCAAFSSGMAATSAVFQSLAPGDHVIIPKDIYHGTRAYLQSVMKPWGLQISEADFTSPSAVESVITEKTRLIWTETPSNPMLHITDIDALADIASKKKILLAVDNTWPTPVNQQPLKLGADLVIHSSTKYLGGHSDILGGAVVTAHKSDFWENIRMIQTMGGAVPSPSDCWLLLRSLKTLPCRMNVHNSNAEKIARWLESHDAVQFVYYPALSSNPGHQVALNQMSGYGGMISFTIPGNAKDAISVVNSSRIITPATSLGGVESTWEHRKSVESPGSKTPENLIRLSVGIENSDDLINDLSNALDHPA